MNSRTYGNMCFSLCWLLRIKVVNYVCAVEYITQMYGIALPRLRRCVCFVLSCFVSRFNNNILLVICNVMMFPSAANITRMTFLTE